LFGWLFDFKDTAMAQLDAQIPAPPEQLAQACAQLRVFVDWMGPIWGWLPVESLIAAAMITLGGFFVGLLVTITRIGVSLMSFGGGGT
jgi:hypothetical protein